MPKIIKYIIMKIRTFIIKSFLITACAAFLAACDKDSAPAEYATYKDRIVGVWISEIVDGEQVLEDDMFVNTYTADGKHLFANRRASGTDGMVWAEEQEGTYWVKENMLYEEGVDRYGKSYLWKSQITIKNGQMYLIVKEGTLDGVNQGPDGDYVVRKAVHNYSAQILGTWKGHETSLGAEPAAHDTYWQYMSDGSYNYYYYNEVAGGYVRKQDNAGRYFLYGNLLASNYSNDINVGIAGLFSECWTISFSGNTMSRWALREGGKVASFEMVRVAAPPVALQ